MTEAEVPEEQESFLGEDAKRIVSKQNIPRCNIHTVGMCTSGDQVRVELLHCTASGLLLKKKREQVPSLEMGSLLDCAIEGHC